MPFQWHSLKCYGISPDAVRLQKSRNKSEFEVNKHFVSSVTKSNGGSLPATYWTKRGIVRLGFFIKSQRAKLFRDWAEDLIINSMDKEAEVINGLVQRVISITGSQNKAAKKLNVNVGVLYYLRKDPSMVSREMRHYLEKKCNNIIDNGTATDPELTELIMQIETTDVRLALWNKLKKAAV